MFARWLEISLLLLRKIRPRPEPSLGQQGEDLAYWHLRRRGFTMVARNYRRAGVEGEIDLVGWDGGTLVFVEVKTRRSPEVRTAEDAVDLDKRRHLIAAARDYRRRAHVRAPYRFDIVSVYAAQAAEHRGPRLEHFPDAFRDSDEEL